MFHASLNFNKLTLQNLGLRCVCLARALQRSAINKVQDNTVGQLLSVLVWRVWGAEVAEVETLDDSLLVVLGRAEDKVAHGIDLDPSSLPELVQG